MTAHTHSVPHSRSDADVLVIGGGAAGLSAALMLGRARRRVVVLDNGTPRNAPASHMHGVLGRDHTSPLDYLKHGRADLDRYDVRVVDATVTALGGHAGHFTATTDDGTTFTARRLIVTTGLTDHLPDLPGLANRWGRDVVQCPYCDGWEVRNRRIGVLRTSPMSLHHATLWRQWTDRMVYLTDGVEPTEDERTRLGARGVDIVTTPVTSVETADDALSGVTLADGTVVPLDALAVGLRFSARSELLTSLGLHAVPHTMGLGEVIEADPTGATSVPGVRVAGNVADPSATVIAATAQGSLVGAHTNLELVMEETDAAVARSGERPTLDGAFWDELYRESDRRWSGNPNPPLTLVAAPLTPGRALDVGCGEGADAVWLAQQGWETTGVDISAVAVDRARGLDDSVTWETRDVVHDPLPEESFDLVTMHYFGILRSDGDDAVRRLAATVAPGGTLLMVSHARVQGHSWIGFEPTDFWSPSEVGAVLDPTEWEIKVDETRPRPAPPAGAGGHHVDDEILVAVRRMR